MPARIRPALGHGNIRSARQSGEGDDVSDITKAIAARQTQITQLKSEIETLQRAASIMGGGAKAPAKAAPKSKPKAKATPRPTPKAKQKPQPKGQGRR